MKRFFRFFHYSPGNQLYLLRTAILMMLIKVGLRTVSFQRLYTLITRGTHKKGTVDAREYKLRRALESIEICSRNTPLPSTCLVRALTGQVLLSELGYAPELRIGVQEGGTGGFEAHAWVVVENRVLIGDRDDLSQYSMFSGLQEKLR